MSMHGKTDSEVTSSLAPSSPNRAVYYVQSPSRDSHDGEKTTNSFHSTPILSPMGSPGHHSRDSSSTRFSGSLKPGSQKSSNGSGRRHHHHHRKTGKGFDAIEEEGLLNEDGGRGGWSRWCYFLVFVVGFFVLFTFFALILWGASRNQPPVVTMKGERIHASMRIDLYRDLKADIKEGSVYKIKNFVVVGNNSRTQTTSHKHKLYFLPNTHVRLDESKEPFPTLIYNFIDFDDIIMDRHLIHNVLLDVIGVVTDYHEPTQVAGISTKRFDFKLSDTEGKQIVCSLWGDFIDLLLPILEKDEEKTVVVCIQFGKINDFNPNELKIQNTYHITKVTVNGTDQVFKDFTDRLGDMQLGLCNRMGPKPANNVLDEFATKIAKFRTLSYLHGRKEEACYWIDGLIVDIVTTTDFWYLACKICCKKVNTDGGKKRCFKCGVDTLTDIYRYKLEVVVTDSTGAAKLLLWNKHCYTLIGQTPNEMRKLFGKNDKGIHQFITRKIIDKRVLFEVKLSCENGENSFKEMDQYAINRMTFDDEVIDMFDAKYNSSQEVVTEDHDALSQGSHVSPATEQMIRSKIKGKGKVIEIPNSEQSNEDEEIEHTNEQENEPNAPTEDQSSKEERNSTYTSKRKRTKKEKVDV